MLYPFNGKRPQLHASVYVHASAQIIGDVVIAADSSVWPNVVVRGDVGPIRIGARSNIQDNSTVHVTRDRFGTIIGDDVTAGHNVTLHGCTIGNLCLIGIGAIVLDGVEVGDECLVGAGALLTPGTKIPPRQLVLGSPAKIVRPLHDDELAHLRQSAQNYLEHARAYRAQGV
ncbi:MAG: gamma carbonic anhydrase family protein [Deltaproteobacteria bacterium]|nr:gamma carbonic anhydrase family protein [Deltaproteobacteria bacterium]MBI3391470.1 gamma carbonic anhydrase family protein [Deltaproteobacteria bacterium]